MISDLAIIGGGILGTTIAYWLSLLFPKNKIMVIEKEKDVAGHTSSRNTGVVHRPFYLDPRKKKIFARSANLSFPFWQAYAKVKQLPFQQIGTIEVATNECQLPTLKKYQKWAVKNGMKEKEIKILKADELKDLEPNLVCAGAIFCKTDSATDFGALTKSLCKDAQNQGVEFMFDCQAIKITKINGGLKILCQNNREFFSRYLINCAGGNTIEVARLLGVAKDLTDINFRGEYWVVKPEYANLAKHNIYAVPQHQKFPFLDPHWVIRWDGQVEIGPNAVPVLGPYVYEGFLESLPQALKKIFEPPLKNKLKLFLNPEFLQLAASEWLSSFTKKVMVARIQKFLPKFQTKHLLKKGLAGVRSSVIDKEGKFIEETIEISGQRSFHILNFNSPGASGAPAYAAYLIKKLIDGQQLGHLKLQGNSRNQLGNFHKIISGF